MSMHSFQVIVGLLLTIISCGNPDLKGSTSSRYFTCSGVSAMSRAAMLSIKCSTFRPPTIGKTYGVFCITYATATVQTG